MKVELSLDDLLTTSDLQCISPKGYLARLSNGWLAPSSDRHNLSSLTTLHMCDKQMAIPYIKKEELLHECELTQDPPLSP